MPHTRPIRLLAGLLTLGTGLVVLGLSATPGAGAAGTAQFQVGTIPDVGTKCLTILADTRPRGPRVIAGRQALQLAFGDGDVVFLEGDGAGQLGLGESLEIVRMSGEADHPYDGDSLGPVVQLLGVLEVIDVSPASDRALGRLVGTCSEIEVGDYVRPLVAETLAEIPALPLFDPDQLIEPSGADAFVVLGAVESVFDPEDFDRDGMTAKVSYAQGDPVIIDQGASEGWSPGDLGVVYREEMPSVYRVAPALEQPPLILGRALAIRVTATDTVMLITDGDFPVELGHRVRNIGPVPEAMVPGNRPPVISCRAERDSVRRGESLRLFATVSDPDRDPTSVQWTASAGSVDPSEGESVTWDSSGAPAGTVSITARASDGAGGEAVCTVDVGVDVPPVPTEASTLSFACDQFAAGSATIDNRCKAVLDDVALQLRQNPRATVTIVGHSDPSGSADVNERMSTERAVNASTYLVETHGLEASRISTEGVGSSQPLQGASAAEMRRIEITLTIPGQ